MKGYGLFTIFDINDVYVNLLAQLESIDVDDPDSDDMVNEILLRMENVDEAKEQKIENYAKIIRELQYKSDMRKLAINQMKKSKHTLDNQVDRLKQVVVEFMNLWNLQKVNGDHLNVSLRKSNSLEVVDEDKIPDKYKTTEITVKIDKQSIKKDLKNQNIPGVSLQENLNLQIK